MIDNQSFFQYTFCVVSKEKSFDILYPLHIIHKLFVCVTLRIIVRLHLIHQDVFFRQVVKFLHKIILVVQITKYRLRMLLSSKYRRSHQYNSLYIYIYNHYPSQHLPRHLLAIPWMLMVRSSVLDKKTNLRERK